MAGERTARAMALFEAALDLAPEERALLLERECGDDQELRREILSLLAYEGKSTDFLESPAEEIRETSMIGRRIGPFRIEDLLGEGGMARVFLATRDDGAFRKEVAIKLITSAAADPQAAERLCTERHLLASLAHPNIATLLDGGTTEEGAPYLVVERVLGEPITEFCDGRALGVEARLRLFLQVCDAVEYAHRHLVVHRDLKPANVLVGDDGIAKVLDFGIAKFLPDSGACDSTRTPVWCRAFTPNYASPEQVRGVPVTTATDVYSLGVLLFELLVGEPPFDWRHCAPGELAEKMTQAEAPRPSTRIGGDDEARFRARRRGSSIGALRRQLAGDLDLVVRTALHCEPARRYASVERLAEDVRRHLSHRPVWAQPPGLGYRLRKLSRRHPARTTAAVFLLIVAALAVVFSAFHARQVRRERDLAEAARRHAAVEEERAEAATRFLTSSFSVFDPLATSAESPTAKEVLAAAAQRAMLLEDPRLQSDVRLTLGIAFRGLGLYDESLHLLEQSLESRRHLGTGALGIAEAAQALAALQLQRGELQVAERLLAETLETRRSLLADDDPRLLESWSTRTELLLRRGRFLEAFRSARRLVDLHRAQGSPRTIEFLQLLARASVERGAFDLAEESLREALELSAEPAVSSTTRAGMLNDLASVVALAGDLDEAEGMHRQAIELYHAALGDEHPLVATALSNLGLLLVEKGDFAEAEDVSLRSLEMKRRLLEAGHRQIADGLDNLGLLYGSRRQFSQAREAFDEALEIRRALGRDDGRLGATIHNLGWLAQQRGDHHTAEELYRQGLEIRRAVLGTSHPLVAGSLGSIANCLRDTGRFEEAEPLYREALEIHRRAYGEDSSQVARSHNGMAALYLSLDRFEEAEAAALEAVVTYRRTLPARHWRTAVAESRLGAALSRLDRRQEAEVLLRRSRPVLIAGRGADSPYVRFVTAELDRLQAASAPDVN